jgi:ribA/ribD-fused uncharacterized protein
MEKYLTFMQRGPRTCRLPGCSKACYVEGNGKVHDYCGRTHAQQHGAMSSPRGGGAGRTTGYARQGSGLSHSGWDNQTGPIYFYNRGEPCYEFTNFYEAVVEIDGQDWLTTEHYFQAQKFVGTPLVRTIRLMERPREAFDKSRDPRYSHWRRSDWEEVKEDIMFKALQAKFTQYQHLKKMLVGTKDRQLVERSPYDSYWGDGGDGSGKNRLGVLLMRLRKDLTSIRARTPPLQTHSDPPILGHSHRQQNDPLHTDSSSPPKHEKREWYTPPSISPEHSSKQSHDLAGQPVHQNTGVMDQNRARQTEPGSNVSTSTTVSHTAPVTQKHAVSFSYSSVVSGRQAVSTTPQPFRNNPVITPSQPNPQLSTVPSQLNYPQSAVMQTTPQPNIASQQPNLQSGASPQSDTPQGSQPAAQPISPLNNISGTGSSPQQLAPTGNLMGHYEITQLTRKQLAEYQANSATSGHLSLPAHVQSSHPPNPASSSRAEEEPSPMDISN